MQLLLVKVACLISRAKVHLLFFLFTQAFHFTVSGTKLFEKSCTRDTVFQAFRENPVPGDMNYFTLFEENPVPGDRLFQGSEIELRHRIATELRTSGRASRCGRQRLRRLSTPNHFFPCWSR